MAEIAAYWLHGVLLLLGLAAGGVLGWYMARGARRLWRGWRYDWARARHLVLPDVVGEAVHTLAESEEHRVQYGSMILAEERKVHHDFLPSLPDMPVWYGDVKDSGWREQTAADLSPEALDEHIHNGSCSDDRCWDGGPGRTADSGPGVVVPLSPGPDPDDCLLDCDPDCESGPRHCWWIHQPSHKRGWHSPADCPHRERSAVPPGPGLGPRAAWVLGCYERRHREKWAWVEPARFSFAEVAA